MANLWRAIIAEPKRLSEGYEKVWREQFQDNCNHLSPREYFLRIRERFNAASHRDPADFLFILNRIVKAALRYNQRGEINQSADGRRVGAKPEVTRQRIMESSNLMQSTRVTSMDWLDCVKDASRDAFIYLDPPYQGTTETLDKRYIAGLPFEQFLEGVSLLIRNGSSALISYDAVCGPVTYGTPLHHEADLLPLDVVTGVSSQGTLLGRVQEAHETLYLTPALVERLGGKSMVSERLRRHEPLALF
ncbi:DNA adenine methylase [Cutibacterium sp. V970]|uniref:DNA adenine methylase n=1 Tax=Cutibacterium sp. V970 TaxID=3446481 RepID=UPI003EE1834A